MADEKVKEEEVKTEDLDADKKKDEQVSDEKPDDVQDDKEEAAPDPDEERALAAGWKPEDQWTGDPKKWVPADEYLRRGELFNKIEAQGKDLKETKKALRMLQEHHAKVKETEYQRAINELKAQKKAALLEGNADVVMEVDDQLMDIRAEKKASELASKQEAARPDPRFVAWVEQNSWYTQNDEMRIFADDIGIAHAKAHPSKTPEEVLEYVEQRVKRVYADAFTNPLRKKPGVVEGRKSDDVKKKTSNFELSEEERKVMMTFVNEGIMTKEQYIEDLKQIKGVG